MKLLNGEICTPAAARRHSEDKTQLGICTTNTD